MPPTGRRANKIWELLRVNVANAATGPRNLREAATGRRIFVEFTAWLSRFLETPDMLKALRNGAERTQVRSAPPTREGRGRDA